MVKMVISLANVTDCIRYGALKDRPIVHKGVIFPIFSTNIGGTGKVAHEFPVYGPADKAIVEPGCVDRCDNRLESQRNKRVHQLEVVSFPERENCLDAPAWRDSGSGMLSGLREKCRQRQPRSRLILCISSRFVPGSARNLRWMYDWISRPFPRAGREPEPAFRSSCSGYRAYRRNRNPSLRLSTAQRPDILRLREPHTSPGHNLFPRSRKRVLFPLDSSKPLVFTEFTNILDSWVMHAACRQQCASQTADGRISGGGRDARYDKDHLLFAIMPNWDRMRWRKVNDRDCFLTGCFAIAKVRLAMTMKHIFGRGSR